MGACPLVAAVVEQESQTNRQVMIDHACCQRWESRLPAGPFGSIAVFQRKEAPYSLSVTHAYHTLVPLHFPATQHDPPILSPCARAVCLLAPLTTLQGWPSLTSGEGDGKPMPCF